VFKKIQACRERERERERETKQKGGGGRGVLTIKKRTRKTIEQARSYSPIFSRITHPLSLFCRPRPRPRPRVGSANTARRF
jgi:hypothetical protein